MKKYNVQNYIRYKEDLKKSMPDDKLYDYQGDQSINTPLKVLWKLEKTEPFHFLKIGQN